MEKITIKSEPLTVEKICKNYMFEKIPNTRWSEAQIDAFVEKDILGRLYKSDNIYQKKTGIKEIDASVPSKDSLAGTGEIDVMVYNLFGNQNIDIVIENKITDVSTETALSEGIIYANGKKDKYKSRVVIGYNGNDAMLKVRVRDSWQDLYINGEKINAFIGPEILKLIYDYPDYNVFEFDISNFTQKEFHKILESLRIIYRNISGLLADNENARIDFTIAYVALKMITEKERIEYQGSSYGWEDFDKPAKINAAVNAIKSSDKYDKYKDIFTIVYNKKTNKVSFDFMETIAEIDVTTINKIHEEISRIPVMHALPIDLFGEVYEVLASKKTKKDLGEFFTRRHIIRPLLSIFINDMDIRNIVDRCGTQNHVKIVDPFCGTGGFLTEFYKLLGSRIDAGLDINAAQLANESFYGYDINPSNSTRTKINMYLAGDGVSDVEKRDSLALEDTDVIKALDTPERPEKFDYVITNVPYGKGKWVVNSTVTNNKRMEINALIKVVSILKPSGKALVIVPDGILESPSLASIRQWLVKNCKINFVISLPKFAFAPYTKEKTYAISITKRNNAFHSVEEQELYDEKFWAYIIDNDGYANSDKRFLTGKLDGSGKWLHNELSIWYDDKGRVHKSLIEEKYGVDGKEQNADEMYYNEWGREITGKKYGFILMRDVLGEYTVNYEKIGRLKSVFGDMSRANDELDDGQKDLLNKISKKSDCIKDGALKEEFVDIFEIMGVLYDAEEDCFYDLKNPVKVHQVNILPEKYFRGSVPEEISSESLSKEVAKIKRELNNIFKDVMKW
ncbi:MAG: N-6 DNA methylase [Lachnospiraceae bacterium]|nr:N-6 DNA methylase [Lachnospiraceae bacterium]